LLIHRSSGFDTLRPQNENEKAVRDIECFIGYKAPSRVGEGAFVYDGELYYQESNVNEKPPNRRFLLFKYSENISFCYFTFHFSYDIISQKQYCEVYNGNQAHF
jgi:hypothetical protein